MASNELMRLGMAIHSAKHALLQQDIPKALDHALKALERVERYLKTAENEGRLRR